MTITESIKRHAALAKAARAAATAAAKVYGSGHLAQQCTAAAQEISRINRGGEGDMPRAIRRAFRAALGE